MSHTPICQNPAALQDLPRLGDKRDLIHYILGQRRTISSI